MKRVKKERQRFSSLADYQDAAGLTDEQVAALVGVTRTTITRIRLGTRVPSMQLAKKICKVSGVPMEKLCA